MLRLLDLTLTNIGPFDHAHLEFVEHEVIEQVNAAPASSHEIAPTVTIITGKNGTGKSILIDAIRGLFGREYSMLERPLWRRNGKYKVAAKVLTNQRRELSSSHGKYDSFSAQLRVGEARAAWNFFDVNESPSRAPRVIDAAKAALDGHEKPSFVIDYWRSELAVDSASIDSFKRVDHKSFLSGSLSGVYKNADTTHLVCWLDYLRGSSDELEKRRGIKLFDVVERIFKKSLFEGGKLLRVERETFTPIVWQAGQEVPLGNLSSGNAYLLHHLCSLLSKMYSFHVLAGTAVDDICNAPGILLMDEAENHLHPLWQKTLIPTIRELFPNLQIVVATHSPFVVASVPNARVYVCAFDGKSTTVSDVTSDYSSRPVDEILATPVFSETRPFSEEISKLLDRRKKAIVAGDTKERRKIEKRLTTLNPQYFAYFGLDERLQKLEEAAKRVG